jgi:hypothetical protein
MFADGIVFSIFTAFLAVGHDKKWWIVFVIMILGIILGL